LNLEVLEISIKAIAVNKKLKEYKEIKELILRSFPENEQFPMWLLRLLAIRKFVDFHAYYDGDSFCGISYTVSSKSLVFVLYLAVNDKIRSKGYGSAILQYIKSEFSGKTIVLNIEPLDVNADNYTQRIKRFEFYLKNGFVDTKYCIVDNGDDYQILATTDNLSVEEYKSALKKLSLGFYAPQVRKNYEA